MTSKKVQFTPKKAFISAVSLVLVLALLITAMCITSKDGGLKVKAASGVLTSVLGNNIIPDEYDGVNVPAGTYLMSETEYAKGSSATPHTSDDGVAAFDFHIFAVNFAAGIHTCGNIAVEHLGGEVLGSTAVPEFGSRSEHTTLSEKLSYIGDTVSWSAATRVDEMDVVFGAGNSVTIDNNVVTLHSNGGSYMIGNGATYAEHCYIDDESDGTPFIDITNELDEAEDYQRYLVWLQEQVQKNSTYVQGWGYATTVNGETARVLTYNDLYTYSWGSITLDFSKYTEETIIVDFDTYYSSGSWWSWPGWYSNANALIAGQVNITGTAGKRVIFNVDTTNLYNDSISFYNITMTVDDISNSEGSVEKDNNVLWNFYQKNSSDGVARSTTGQIDISGTWVGTVLAPDATINCNAGLNGSMIAENITSGCETHKSDYTGEKINQTEDDGTTSLTVTKIWDDNPDTRPEFISVKLLRNDVVYKTVQLSTDNVTESADGNTWTYTFEDLELTAPDGSYYRYTIDEVVPAGYTKTIFNNTIINVSEGGVVENPEYGSITVNKTAKGYSALLGGAWFKLTSSSGANLSGATVVDGTASSFNATDNEITWCSVEGVAAVIGNLPVGDYTLYETSAPAGYMTAASTAVKVEKDTNSEYTVENEQIKIKLAKLEENGDMLTGATLQITSAYGADLSKLTVAGATVLEQTSSVIKVRTTGTEFTLAGITEGYYTLTELEAPEGYQIAAPITFYVNNSGAVYDSNWNWLSRVDMTDTLAPEEEPEAVTHTISINKTDGANALSGAVLELTSVTGADLSGVTLNGATNESTDAKVIRWTSNGSAVTFENLPEGYYTLTEITAPAGYKKAAQMTLDVKAGSTEFTMTDSVITMSVSKRDKNSGVEISGASLKLTAKDENEKDIDLSGVTAENADNFVAVSSAVTWISNGTPAVFTKLPAGYYTLSEVTAPAGYSTAADINFTIDEYGNITGSSISGGECVMYDEPVTLDIAKLYWNDKDGNSNASSDEKGTLAGAKLKLTANVDLTNVTGTITVTHEADGSLTWTSGTKANTLRGLPDGTYTLTELAAPDGYDSAEAITFTVSGGVIKSCTTANTGDEYGTSYVKMCDKKTVFYQVQISKVDAVDNTVLLEGATIGIFPEGTTSFIADNAVVVYESTDAPNELILSNGNYILRELKAPEGYDLNTECICFTVVNGNVTITDVYTPAGNIVVGKMEDTYENCDYFNGDNLVHVNITEFVEANGHMPPDEVVIKIPSANSPEDVMTEVITAMAYLDSENQGVAGIWTNIEKSWVQIYASPDAVPADQTRYVINNYNGYDYYCLRGLPTPNVDTVDVELDRSLYSVAELLLWVKGNSDYHSTEELWSQLGAEISIFYGDTEIILGDKIVKGESSGTTSTSSSALFTDETIPVEYWNWFVGYHVDITEQVAQYGWPTEFSMTPNDEDVFSGITYDVVYSADGIDATELEKDSISANDADKKDGVWTYPIDSSSVSDYNASTHGKVYLIAYVDGGLSMDIDTFNSCNPIIVFGDVEYSGDTGSDSEESTEGDSSGSTESSGITTDSVIVEEKTDSKPVLIKLPNSETPQADRYLYAVKLTKKDGSGNGITYNPAQFVLYDSNGNPVRLEGSDGVYKYNYEKESDLVFESTGFTDNTQTKSGITLSELPVAINYNLPGGVVEGSTVEIVIANSDGNSLTIPAQTLTTTNGSFKNIDFDSLDYQTGETLTVTVNETYPDGSNVFTVELDFVYPLYTSNAEGTINVTGLWLGDYYFVETEAPANYKNENGTVGFTLTEWNTEGNPAKLSVKNILEQGSIIFTKTDDKGNPKEGAIFELYRLSPSEIWSTDPTSNNNPVGNYTTDHTGKVTAGGLDLGYLYYAVEVTAPAGTENSNAGVKLPQLESTGINASRYVINNNIISFGIYLGEYSDSVKAQVLNYDLSGSESAATEWVDVDTVVTDGSMSVVNNAYRTTFLKTDGTNPLAGATFKLTLKNAGEKAQLNLVSANVITTETVEAKDENGNTLKDESGNVVTKTETVYTPVALTHYYNRVNDSDGNFVSAEEYLMWTSTDDAEGITLLGLPNLEYTLEEISAPEGYEKDSEVKTVTVGTGFDNVVDYEIVNDKLYGSITLVKNDSVTGARMANVEFVLETSTDGGATWSTYNTYTTDANGIIIADNLPYGASYRFRETVPVGYTTENELTDVITIEGETSAELVHKVYVSNTPETTSVSGTKTWDDDDDNDRIRPESITVNLLANGTEIDDVVVTADDNWTYEFTDLPKYKDGQLIEYTVTEDTVPGYTAAVNGFDITNTHFVETISISGTKTWNDADNQDGIRPRSITVNLLADGAEVKEVVVKADTSGNWTYEFTDLVKYNDGKEIVYTVTEDAVDNYTTEIQGYNITNSYTPGKTSVTVTKVWNDTDDQDGKRPTSVTVNLLANGTKVATKELTEQDNWTYTFSELDLKSNGKEINYTVEELSVEGYTVKITGDATSGYTITNTHTPETIEISGTKTWVDADNQDGIRPTSITVNLLADGTEIKETVVKADTDGNWTYEFTDLAKYNDGKEIVYTVTEDEVAGYETEINGYNITNTHTTETTSVSGTKTWSDNNDQDGIRPESITVNLLADGTEVKEAVVKADASGNWAYEFTDLAKYRDGGTLVVYTVTEDEVAGYETTINGYNITNTHTTETTSVSGTKTWSDNNDQDGIRPESITVNLLADGTEVKEAVVKADASGNWTYEFTNLTKYRDGGTLVVYTVTEDEVTGYETTINGYNITNTHTTETTSVSGTKTWSDNNDQDGIRPESITVNLLADGTEVKEAVVKADASGNWAYEFTDLAKYRDGGTLVVYTVTEDEVAGYETEINGYNITNTHTTETTSVSGTKTWSDNNDQDGKRPESITVNLYADGTKASSKTVTADASGNWTYEFTDLDKFKGGKEIVYTITEDKVEGYTTEINGYNITNSYTPDVTSVSVEKIWSDSKDQDGKRPASITVSLLAEGEIIETKTVTANDGWNCTFSSLPKYSGGKEIAYTVSENAVTGYSTEISGNAADGFVITNSYTPETTSVSGVKTWNDVNDQDGKRPDFIIVNLLADGEKISSTTVTEGDDGTWSYTFENLPKYRDGGTEIKYTVTEEDVEGYTATIIGTNITNTHVPEVTSVNGTKLWDDNENQDGIRPASVTVNLLADGVVKKTTTVEASSGWTYSFDSLPKYRDGGTEIVYTVTEEEVEGYETSIDGYTVTNSHTPEKTSVSGMKTWSDNNDQDGKRPESITVNLLANGTKVDSKTVTENDGWAYTFANLDKYSAGKAVVYTVAEETVEGYTASVDGYNITNTYTPEVISVSGTKTWVDSNDNDGLRPETITVNLLANGEKVKDTTVTEGADGKWTYTFDNLPKYEAGEEIAYTVTENAVEYYTTEIDGYNITNTHAPLTGSITLTAKKTLEGKTLGNEKFSFTLKDSEGNVIETVSNNGANITFTALNYTYSDIGTHTYTITEGDYNSKGITNDKTVHTVTVTVAHNGGDSLTVTADKNGGEIEFVNVYTAAPVKVQLKGDKTLSGRTLAANEFSFTLTGEGKNETVKNAADGSITFSEITYDTIGTYEYTVTEVNDGKGGITYDSSVYTWTVKVTDNGEGQLTAEETLKKNGAAAEALEFANSYATGSTTCTISGVKELTGRKLAAGEFEFALSEGGTVLQTVSNAADGSFTFDAIKYTAAGSHTYTVKEVVPAEKKGVEYDTKEYTVTVKVTDNGDGTLKATPSVNGEEIAFKNTYTAAPAKVVFDGTKTFNKTLEGEEFSFVLKDAEGEVIETVKNAADGSFTFAELTLSEVKTYTYTISEVIPADKKGITYDESVYTWTVKVTDNGEGQLVTEKTLTKDGKAASEVEFANSYAAAPTTYTISGTKVLTGKALEAGMFSFTISDTEGVIATATNTENGTFTFDAITYTEAGTYEYTVEEVIPDGDKMGITYDGRKYTVEVSVIDDGNGNLVATGTDNLSERLKFENSYTAQPAKVSVNGVKTLNGRDITEGEFEFTLSDAENNVLQTVKNSASGTFVFEDITLNVVGEYTYTIKETVGSAEDISYDTTEYVMTVNVTDNGNGELEAVRTIVKKGEEGEAGVRFVNDVVGAYITISKRAMTGSDELPGAKLTLTPEGDIDLSKVDLPEGTELKDGSITWTSSDKPVVLGVVPNGVYEFKEVTAPNGYDVAEIIYVKVEGSSVYAVPASEYKEDGNTEWGNAVSENTVIMKDAPNKLVLSKKELANGPELEGAKLILKPVDSSIDLSDVEIPENVSCTDNVITWTSGKEETEIGKVPDGIYEFTEITAPDGYEVAETIYVKVSASDIYYASGADSEKWTSVGESDTVVMLDAPTKLVISKIDAVKSEELPGAVLTIEPVGDIDLSDVRAPEEVSVTDSKITWTSTNEKTEIEKLPQGIYTLTETTAPNGYERDEVAYIKVSGSDIYSVKKSDYKGDSTDWVKEDDETVVMEDAYNTLVLSKVEFGGGAELPNAMLTLEATSSDTDLTVVVTSRSDIAKSKKSISWVSTDKALDLHFVPDGIYKFTELIAPAGYEIAEFIYVKVENGDVYYAPSIPASEWKLVGNDTVVMEDKPTELVISKKAVGGGSELPGAVLKLESADGTADLSKVRIPEGVTYKDNTITWTSGDDAVEFERIPNGVYKFTEVTAPEGYEIAETIYVKVSDSDIYAVKASDYSGETTEWGKAVDNDTVVMYDAPVVIPKTANISFVKYSNINTKLNGAVFTLTSADGTKKTATSGSDGVVMFTAVPEGTYSLAETTAPNNYNKSTNIITVIVDSDGAVSYTGPNGNAIDIMGVEQLMKNNIIPVEDNKDVTVGDTVDLRDQLIKENPDLKDETITWGSSDDSIASVDQNGKVTVKKPGKVTINAYKNGTVVGTFVLGASEEYVPPTNITPNTGDSDTPTTGDDNKDIIAWNIAIASLVVALATAKAINDRRKKRANTEI